MKKITTLITTFVILSFFAAISARADLIWYEGFQYPNGSLTSNSVVAIPGVTTNSLWIKDSGTATAPGDMLVGNSNLQVSATGGTLSRQDDCCRWLSLTNNSTFTNHLYVIYASFTVICTNLPNNGNGSYFASFYSFTNNGFPGFGYYGRVQAFTNFHTLPNSWRLGVTDNAKATNNPDGGFPVDLALNTPYQVVEELDPTPSGLQAATIWVNPTDINQTGSSPSETHYTANDALGANGLAFEVNSYAFRQGGSFGNSFFLITNLAVATSFAEAATNVWTTNAVAPTIVYQPIAGVSNYVGASVTLSALANGQGLGNMTYQWQVSAAANNSSPVNVSGGEFSGINANILNINNAQTGDTGYYTLIATTPYGLSATSSVARVSITAAPVPPSFVPGGQPVSQTVYKGQTVVFSAQVISPGNVTFTWYSNNVAVTAGVSSAGDTSSLELDNVTTNASGSYKVAVTNDVVPNGIVSTNAVLTVNNPPVVSIAYLRTLVDPNNGYSSTAPLTAPYQITGTVTTFTNLTTGNTASYYLQDGTAGINIFITGGSTFRPAQGAVVTFVGVLSSFSTGLELYADSADLQYPYTSYTDTGATNALPTPINIPFNITSDLSNVNYNLGESLVKLTDVYFTNAGTTISTSANETVTVTNSSGQQFKVEFFYLDLDTAGQTLPSYAYSVSGVLYGINTNFTVAVTRFADIVTTPPPSPIPLNAIFSGGSVTFTWSDATFSLQSSTSVSGPYTTIPGAATGFSTNTTSAPTMFFRLYNPTGP